MFLDLVFQDPVPHAKCVSSADQEYRTAGRMRPCFFSQHEYLHNLLGPTVKRAIVLEKA